MFHNFEELKHSLSTDEPKTLIVAAAHDKHTLEAVYEAAESLPMKYILVGDRVKIEEISREMGKTPEVVIDAIDDDDSAYKSVALIREGKGNVLMKGILETRTLLKAVLDKENGIRRKASGLESHQVSSGTMSHLAMLEVPSYHKLISVSDGGMLPHPTLEQKADIIRNASKFYHRLGIKTPIIAALAAAEAVNVRVEQKSLGRGIVAGEF